MNQSAFKTTFGDGIFFYWLLIKMLISNLLSTTASTVKIQCASDRIGSCKCFLRCLITITSCSLAQYRRKDSAGYRRKLPTLIDNFCNAVRKLTASYPVHDNRSYGNFSYVAFSPCLTLNNCCQKRQFTVRCRHGCSGLADLLHSLFFSFCCVSYSATLSAVVSSI